MLFGDVIDQFHDGDGLADAGAAEQPDLAAARIRAYEIDYLDAGFENLDFGRLIGKSRRDRDESASDAALDAAAPSSTGSPMTFIRRPSVSGPTGTRIGLPVSLTCHPAHQALGRVHRDAAHGVFAQMLRDFEHEVALAVTERRVGDAQRIEDRRQRAVAKLDVDDVAENLADAAC